MRFGPGCLVHDLSTIWADASRSVDPVCASRGVALLGERERSKCNRESQNNVFHFERFQDSVTQQMPDTTLVQHIFQLPDRSYRGACAEHSVDPTTPIFGNATGDRSVLVPGAAVFVIASKHDDGTLTSTRLYAEKDGIKPPM